MVSGEFGYKREVYMKKKKKEKRVLVGIFIFLLLPMSIPLFWLVSKKWEGEIPRFEFQDQIDNIGVSTIVTGKATDQKTGLKRILISLSKDGNEITLYDESYPSTGFLRGSAVHNKIIRIQIQPQRIGVSDGEAILKVRIWDYSWRGRDGNCLKLNKRVTIDTCPPEIQILTRAHNINQGGTCLAIYRLFEPVAESGVLVEEKLFRGYSGYFSDHDIYLAFFALPYNKGSGTRILLTATDLAGNRSVASIPFHINSKRFHKDMINITDDFLRCKMPEFEGQVESSESLIDTFLRVNRDLRRSDMETISNVCQTSASTMLWKGRFLRMKGSEQKAGFADYRTYRYKGHIVDHQVHLGIDLASLVHSPVQAANTGRIIFTGRLGIYGNTVIIDHGFGLFSMYAHLSRLRVKTGQTVERGDIIGNTGSTGLAGGDHLHFGMIVQGTFVNPREWWDPLWVKHNVTEKIDSVLLSIGEER
nr:M23 family metallopeptidase [Desulfobacterales bacterium]